MNASLELPAHPAAPTAQNHKRESFLSLVRGLINGNPDPDNPRPPGPWDPIIRKALTRAAQMCNDRFSLVAFDPQPIPRVAVALAQTMIEHVTDMHEVASLMPGEVQGAVQRAISGHLARFIDDCGNGTVRLSKFPPFPWPPRDDSAVDRLNPIELVVTGVTFENAARSSVHGALQKDLAQAGATLIGQGIADL